MPPPTGPRLAWQPVEELKALRSRAIVRSSGEMKPGDITDWPGRAAS